ncbi:MAG: cytochrome c-type biogenesis protein CcmH [Chloroflexi bacterium]|nr:cytochrome c-type biogenesis protein CcmH [Chloroflexota bacterium]
MPVILLLLILVTLLAACSAASPADSIDEKARDIYRSLMCPICSGQTLEESQSELSAQMRVAVREMLEQGKTKEEILQFFVDRYGVGVLAAPPKSNMYLLVWLAPVIGLAIGGLLVVRVIKAGLRRKESATETAEPDNQYWEKRLASHLKDWETKNRQ